MTKMTRFVDSFWESDFCGTKGFDALTKRMKIGRNTCKELHDFFQQRAAIEKEYSAKLQKLSKSMERKSHNSGESQSLDHAIGKMIEQSENVATLHSEVAKLFSDRVEKLREFSEKQKDEKKKLEDNLKRSQNNKISQYTKTMSLQKTYKSKCLERNHAKDQLDITEQAVTSQVKEIEKLKAKYDKAHSTMEQADSAFKSSVESLEQVRKTWEKDMEDTCTRFQVFEMERIEFLRNDMWLYCNLLSQLCVDIDECCEQTRKELDQCSVENDIQDFITDYRTGSERPPQIAYENYYQSPGGRKTTPTPGRRSDEPLPLTPKPPLLLNSTCTSDGHYATLD